MSLGKKIFDVATILLFGVGLCLPFLDEETRSEMERAVLVEFRVPSRAPVLPVKARPLSADGIDYLTSAEGIDWLTSMRGLRWLTRYPERFGSYYADSFGHRDRLIRAHGYLSWRWLGVSPSTLALRGEEDWIFTTSDHEQEVWRGALPFTEAEVDAWIRCLRTRREVFAQHGIEYLLCVAPDKARVYPERLPDWARPGKSRLEQLTEALGDEDLGLIQPLEAIRSRIVDDREQDFVYRRLGSHWTDRGAKAAADFIAERLRETWPQIPLIRDADCELESIALDLTDDMGARLYVSDELLGERREYQLTVPLPRKSRGVEMKGRNMKTRNITPGLPSAVVLHDSFGTQLRPFLSEYLGETSYLWTYEMDMDEILAEKPDVVLQVVVERSLNFLLPAIPRAADASEPQERFESSDEVLLDMRGDQGWQSVSPGDGTRLRQKPHGLAVEAVRGRAGLWLPDLVCPPGRDLVFRIEIQTSQRDSLRLILGTKSAPEFNSRMSLQHPLEEGRNVLYLEVLAPELEGAAYLIPFRDAPNAVVRSLEVRAVAH